MSRAVCAMSRKNQRSSGKVHAAASVYTEIAYYVSWIVRESSEEAVMDEKAQTLFERMQ